MALQEALSTAIDLWRAITKLAFPLYGSRQVIQKRSPNSEAPLSFYTDNEHIYVELNDEKEAEDDFDSYILPAYRPFTESVWSSMAGKTIKDNELRRLLWTDSLIFILFHELYHPIVCPDSEIDEREITCAIYRGLTKDYSLARASQLSHHVKNLFWDLVVNVTFLARLDENSASPFNRACQTIFSRNSRRQEELAASLVPGFYYQSACKAKTDLLISVTGALYSYLSISNEKFLSSFLAAFDNEGKRLQCQEAPSQLALLMLTALLTKDKQSPLINTLLASKGKHRESKRLQTVAKLLAVFQDSDKRYAAIERAASVLAPYVSTEEPQGSFDSKTRGHRGSAGEQEDMDGLGDTLQDLAEGLSKEELDELQESLGQQTGASSGSGDVTAHFGSPSYIMAADSFYKKEAKPLQLRQPSSDASIMDIGAQKRWKLKNVQSMTCADVARLDMASIHAFQSTTGLPLLMELAPGHYQLNEYEIVKSPLKAYTFVDDLNIPDNWVLIVDSSGSMASTDYLGSGSRYDILMRVCYGVAIGLRSACDRLHRDLAFGVMNFSSSTKWSGMMSFKEAYDRVFNPVKKHLLVPQCAGTALDVTLLKEAKKELKTGTTVYTVVTDGEVEDEKKVYKELCQLTQEKNSCLVYIEIECRSTLGKKLQSNNQGNIHYFSLNQVDEIETVLGSILLDYSN